MTVTSSYSFAGGVCGYLYSSSSSITNCYNIASVSGTSTSGIAYVGGVFGCGNSNTSATNCYSAGTVSGTASSTAYVGGVCGSDYEVTITNCYYNSDEYSGDAIGSNSGTATNVEGKTTDQFSSGEVCNLLQGEQTDPV